MSLLDYPKIKVAWKIDLAQIEPMVFCGVFMNLEAEFLWEIARVVLILAIGSVAIYQLEKLRLRIDKNSVPGPRLRVQLQVCVLALQLLVAAYDYICAGRVIDSQHGETQHQRFN